MYFSLDELQRYIASVISNDVNAYESLTKLSIEVANQENLLDDERNEWIALIEKHISVLPPQSKRKPIAENDLDLYPDYDLNLDSFLPHYTTLIPEGMSYPIWIKEFFLKEFFTLPNPEIVLPVVSTLFFINSKAMPPKMKLPIGYFFGVPGGGKSSLANQITYHYPLGRYYSTAAYTSGTSLRNYFNDICTNENGGFEPAAIHLENFYGDCFTAWGVAKMLLLANSQYEAKTAVASKENVGTNQVFFTHCFKMLTSIHDPRRIGQEGGKELERRIIPVHFARKAEQKMSFNGFDWSDRHLEHRKIWNFDDVQNKFRPLLIDVLRTSPQEAKIQEGHWEPSQLICAIGVFVGIWQSLPEAYRALAAYWEYFDAISPDSGNTPLSVALDGYLSHTWPLEVKRILQQTNGAVDLSLDRIPLLMIFDYFDKRSDFKKVTYNEKTVTYLMQERGYKVRQILGEIVYERIQEL